MTRRSTSARPWMVLFLITFASPARNLYAQVLPEEPADSLLQSPVFPKSQTAATVLAVTGTLVPAISLAALAHGGGLESLGFTETVVLFTVGFAVGPSLGHFYSGELGMLPIRTAVVGTFGSLLLLSVGMESLDLLYGTLIMAKLIGMPIFAALALHDIATASHAARRFNDRTGLGAVRIQPFYSPEHHAPGLAVRISF